MSGFNLLQEMKRIENKILSENTAQDILKALRNADGLMAKITNVYEKRLGDENEDWIAAVYIEQLLDAMLSRSLNDVLRVGKNIDQKYKSKHDWQDESLWKDIRKAQKMLKPLGKRWVDGFQKFLNGDLSRGSDILTKLWNEYSWDELR